MCAIIDANVVSEIFENKASTAGVEFRRWILEGGMLIVGGKLLLELMRGTGEFGIWYSQLVQAGRVTRIGDNEIDAEKRKIQNECKSDDKHIIALARISGARLLYSNDIDLHEDFKNRSLIDLPRGKVYSTNKGKSFQKAHRRLLANRNICGNKGRK